MPRDYRSLAPTDMRRADRAMDDAWIEALLHRAPVGVLATSADGQPFVNSNTFVYDASQRAVYVHTARVGRTRANVEGPVPVCFSVFEMGRLLPAWEALEFSVEYDSVVCFGTADVVTGDEARAALNLLLAKYAPHLTPGEDYRPVTDDELKRTAVFRVAISDWTGKRKAAAPDFPGAYRFEDVVP